MTGSPPLPEPLLDLLNDRTTNARAEVEALTAAIADLTTRLRDAQQLLTRLELTRQTLTELTAQLAEQAPPDDPTDGLPTAYQDILTALARNPDGMRAKDIALALGLPADDKTTTEGLRAKLKRLVGRGLLNEHQPGLFTPNSINS